MFKRVLGCFSHCLCLSQYGTCKQFRCSLGISQMSTMALTNQTCNFIDSKLYPVIFYIPVYWLKQEKKNINSPSLFCSFSFPSQREQPRSSSSARPTHKDTVPSDLPHFPVAHSLALVIWLLTPFHTVKIVTSTVPRSMVETSPP